MKNLTLAIISLIGLALCPVSATAAQDAALFELASRYEAEVAVFEQIVLGVRGIDRSDERLVDRLHDEARKLRLAARNPRHFNRLFYQWRDIQKLHLQTETNLFGKYTPHHDLLGQWERIIFSYALFTEEIFLHVENPQHSNSVRRIDSDSARRQSYFGSGN